MTDEQILQRLKLSDPEATEVCQRIVDLNPAQIRALRATTDRNEAAAAIGPDCSPEDLQRFIDRRKGHHRGIVNGFFMPTGEC